MLLMRRQNDFVMSRAREEWGGGEARNGWRLRLGGVSSPGLQSPLKAKQRGRLNNMTRRQTGRQADMLPFGQTE